MILCVDIGNTNTVFGIFSEKNLIKKIRLTTYKDKTEDEFEHLFSNLLEYYKSNIFENIIICSVVPSITEKVAIALKNLFHCPILFITSGIKTGLVIRTDDPTEVGADLVAGAVGVIQKYHTPSIIIDLGTATKFIILDEPNILSGVVIAPGLKISVNALTSIASQLPEISLVAPEKVYGKNTLDSMNAGAIYGCCSMIEGMVKRIQNSFHKNFEVILTGGIANKIKHHLQLQFIHDDNLVLDGIFAIYEKNKEKYLK